ncbi:MAG: hypothetical protein ACLP9S_15795 [Syntrophales bacterium]
MVFKAMRKETIFWLYVGIIVVGLSVKCSAENSTIDQTIAYFNAVQNGDLEYVLNHNARFVEAIRAIDQKSNSSWSINQNEVENKKNQIIILFKNAFVEARKEKWIFVENKTYSSKIALDITLFQSEIREIYVIFPKCATLSLIEVRNGRALLNIKYGKIKPWMMLDLAPVEISQRYIGLTKKEALGSSTGNVFQAKESFIEIGNEPINYEIIQAIDLEGNVHKCFKP